MSLIMAFGQIFVVLSRDRMARNHRLWGSGTDLAVLVC